jgi:hypothetical protein
MAVPPSTSSRSALITKFLSSLIVCGLLLTGVANDADAHKRKRRHKHRDRGEVIRVVDRTSHGDLNRETVEDYVALGIPLRYTVGNPGDGCQPVPEAIVLCEAPLTPAHVAKATVGLPRGGAWITYNTLHPDPGENVACHEFMHVLAAIGDAYGSDAQSCVWGFSLNDPGLTDLRLLREAGRIP